MVDLRQDSRQPFNVAVIDEATQLVEASTAQVLSSHLKCLVLAGDNQQLPSTVISMLATKNMYGRRYNYVDHHNKNPMDKLIRSLPMLAYLSECITSISLLIPRFFDLCSAKFVRPRVEKSFPFVSATNSVPNATRVEFLAQHAVLPRQTHRW